MEASAKLRDRLLAELNDVGNGEAAASWAMRCLPEKDKLTAIRRTLEAAGVEFIDGDENENGSGCGPGVRLRKLNTLREK
jgi:hypothetical protein